MLYHKNLPGWERGLRIALGAALIFYGIVLAGSTLLMALALGSAAVVLITGFVGFCPVCSLAGRAPVKPRR
jgi:hypothetical protein